MPNVLLLWVFRCKAQHTHGKALIPVYVRERIQTAVRSRVHSLVGRLVMFRVTPGYVRSLGRL